MKGKVEDRSLGAFVGAFIVYSISMFTEIADPIAAGAAGAALGGYLASLVPATYRAELRLVAALAAATMGVGVVSGCAARKVTTEYAEDGKTIQRVITEAESILYVLPDPEVTQTRSLSGAGFDVDMFPPSLKVYTGTGTTNQVPKDADVTVRTGVNAKLDEQGNEIGATADHEVIVGQYVQEPDLTGTAE